ncbi:MAG: hypothetical protein L0H70_07095, partial [Xanthomonadales bacterium]|nr:hypothetical protein [Xanthomonadales bacterium]
MPRHTTPTWEVEMLISGAAVFAVLQLPSWLTHQVFHWLPRLNDDWGGALSTLYIYLMSATVMLALTFIFHLALRAHWIALIGMHSVFPGGIRWANARMGPVQLAVEQKRLGSVARAVDRADNRATVVFAVGVMLTTMLVALCLIVAPMFAAILLADHVLGSSTLITLCLVALPLLIALPYQWARRYDQRKGAQLPANSRLRRVMTWIFSSNIRLGSSRNSYAWTLLATNVGRHRINVAVWLVLLPVLGAAALSIVSMQSPNALASYGLFPYDPGGMRAQNTAYYDDQRDIGHLQTVPYIQSAIITGPYVRLVVPWRPDVDARAVREQCSKDLPKQTAAERASSTLDCLGALLAVRLDGKPLT